MLDGSIRSEHVVLPKFTSQLITSCSQNLSPITPLLISTILHLLSYLIQLLVLWILNVQV